MKSYFGVLLVLISGCSTDLDIMEEHPTVPVIYAIINMYDSVQYVRVEKTFRINTKEDFSKLNSDSLQFNNVEVFLYGKKGDSIKWVEQFSKTSIKKDNGFFPTENCQTYKLDHALPINLSNPGRYYYGHPDIDSLILEVIIHDLNLVTRAAAPALSSAKITAYTGKNLIYVYGDRPSLFALPSVEKSNGKKTKDFYRQIEFYVHFKEYYENSFSIKEISWMTYNGFKSSGYLISPERLFNRMKLLLPKNDSILVRTLDSIDLRITVPCTVFNKYWFVREHWEDSDYPPFTNFDHSYGLFLTVATAKLTGLVLTRRSMDSLCDGYYYKEMKFRHW